MIKRNLIYCICVLGIALFFVQCNKNKDDQPTPESTFDKQGMFRNVGESIIIPAYADLKKSLDSLQIASNQFVSNPTLTNLTSLQSLFVQAYTGYQWISVFEFGPADMELIRANFNTFPCDTAQINSKIAAGDFNLTTVADLDAKGFPALDFLLYGKLHNNDSVLAYFTTGANSANRLNYVATLVNELKTKTDIVYNAWIPTGGNYLNTFITNTGTDVGSSLGLLVNQLNYDFETLKNFKIAIPLGKKTLGVPLPEKVEALYSQISSFLAVQQLKAIENIYLGRSRQGADGLGLDDYLIHLNSSYNGGLLSEAIKSQLTVAVSKLQNVPDPLSQTVVTNPLPADEAYIELQKQVVLFKTDMPSSLGVLITYLDNDGD